MNKGNKRLSLLVKAKNSHLLNSKQYRSSLANLAVSLFLSVSTSCYASTLIEELKNTKATSLNLSGKNIGDEGAKVLARNANLTSLNLTNNNLSFQGVKALAYNTNLTSLNLSYNNIGDEGAITLASNTTLISLDLSYSKVWYEGAVALKLLLP